MPNRRLLTAAVCALAALGSPAAAQAEDLFATVGPEFTISLRNTQGQVVTRLDPGPYRIVVQDRGDFHNFHLSGPGVNLATDVGGVETVTWDVTFLEGRYTFMCDAHSTSMKGAFTVGNPPPLPMRLVATVGPSNSITLARNGVRVRTLTAGAYVIVVRDRSKRLNFHLTGPGVNRKTAVARTGTVTWNLTLGAGVFRYVSDPQAKRVRGSFVVT